MLKAYRRRDTTGFGFQIAFTDGLAVVIPVADQLATSRPP
jgi:hypothetical protein